MIAVQLLDNFKRYVSDDPNFNISPAYESAGMDLYNAGESFQLPPVLDYTIESVASDFGSWLCWNAYSVKQVDFPAYVDQSLNYYYKQLIPTGIKVAIPQGYVGLLLERGSVVKTPLKIRAGVIDSGYTGEIFVNALNLSPTTMTIQRGAKLPFQLIVVPCQNNFYTVSEEVYKELTTGTKRGEGKIGSSDSKPNSGEEPILDKETLLQLIQEGNALSRTIRNTHRHYHLATNSERATMVCQ